MEGWIKSHRIILDNPIVCKDAEHYAVWGYLLHNAAHRQVTALFNGRRITLQPGQLITGRRKIAEHFKIAESKVQRVLKYFESEQQIARETTSTSSLISVVNWSMYQGDDVEVNSDRTATEQRPNSDRTATEQPMNTIQECKNERIKECKNNIHIVNLNLDFSSCVSAQERARELHHWVATVVPGFLSMAVPFTATHAEWIVSKYAAADIERIFRAMDNNNVPSSKRNAYNSFNAYANADNILKQRTVDLAATKFYTHEEVCNMTGSGQYLWSDFTTNPVEGGKPLWVLTQRDRMPSI